MKPDYEKIIEGPEQSFLVKVVERESRPSLSQAWHFHPELEICFTMESFGRRFTGNQIVNYQANDLVMFGPNLPHGFTTDVFCKQVVIQMTEDFLGYEFLKRPEMWEIRQLLTKSRRGLHFGPRCKKKAAKLIKKLLNAEGFNRLLILLELLHLLANTKDVGGICSEEYALDFNEAQLGRVSILYAHAMQHFHQSIRVKEIADKLNLSEAGFYKFVKRHTKKTYVEIVNDFRIHHACRLLINTKKTVAEICYESGYNNLSYFNRKFKSVMGQNPRRFRDQYLSSSAQ
ncbi:MAG: AraC family transcriptional regulator [Bacteroidota bacterium]